MLSRCLNPNCGAQFRYLGEGRVFTIEQVHSAPGTAEPQRSAESYWLCGTCSSRVKVIVENGRVMTFPIDVPSMLVRKTREMTSAL